MSGFFRVFCASVMENCSRALSGTIHDTTYLWMFGALKELVDHLHLQNELQHLDSVASFIEATAVNVALRLGSRAVTIRAPMHSETEDDDKLRPDRCHLTVTTVQPKRGTVHVYFEHGQRPT
ncbi:hypothetical protein V8E54_009086 [Elaphomyces granulatus]